MNALLEAARQVLFEGSNETTKISAYRSTPDEARFNERWLHFTRGDSIFIWSEGVLLYTKIDESLEFKHYEIVRAIEKYIPNCFSTHDLVNFLKAVHIYIFGNFTLDHARKLVKDYNDNALTLRMNNVAGRLWTGVKAPDGKNTNVIVVWSNEDSVKPKLLDILLKAYKIKDFYWCGVDSSYYNEYSDKRKDLGGKNIKKLKSRLFPNLSHEEIVEILIKAHTSSHKLTANEKKVVDEFRGADADTWAPTTGGYKTRAEFHYRSRMSEEIE